MGGADPTSEQLRQKITSVKEFNITAETLETPGLATFRKTCAAPKNRRSNCKEELSSDN